jgi:hypothetical protein
MVRCWSLLSLLLLASTVVSHAQGPAPATIPSLGQDPSFKVWEHSTRDLQPVKQERRSYRALGTWIGFGVGLALSPLTWGLCEDNGEDCTTSEKIMHAGLSGAVGAFMGFLIGGSIKRD